MINLLAKCYDRDVEQYFKTNELDQNDKYTAIIQELENFIKQLTKLQISFHLPRYGIQFILYNGSCRNPKI